MPTIPNSATVVSICTRRIGALRTYVDGRATISVGGAKHSHGEVLGIYKTCIDVRGKLASLRAQLADALEEVRASDAQRMNADRALKGWVREEFGLESTEANDFGFPPAKPPTMTVEQRALAVERGKATRKARRTMGRNQRAEIRGVVEEQEPQP